jgi:hypothetical protein
MSNWMLATLGCVVLSAVSGWADDKPTPPASAKPDDKDKEKDKKPTFRTGAVRYQVKDVDKSVEFYAKHLGFQSGRAVPRRASLRRRLEREPHPVPERAEEFGGTRPSRRS